MGVFLPMLLVKTIKHIYKPTVLRQAEDRRNLEGQAVSKQ